MADRKALSGLEAANPANDIKKTAPSDSTELKYKEPEYFIRHEVNAFALLLIDFHAESSERLS